MSRPFTVVTRFIPQIDLSNLINLVTQSCATKQQNVNLTLQEQVRKDRNY